MTPERYAQRFLADLTTADLTDPRTEQAEARILGFSDIGGCPEQARRFLNGDPFTDLPDLTAARIGKWVDAGIKEIRKAANPNLLTDLEVSCTLPSGIRITGHPDEVDPNTPIVVDYKTKDGIAAVRRTGPDEQQRIQRALQYYACLQSGVFTSEDGWVGNAYLDRSGKDPDVYVDLEPWSEAKIWVERADTWLLEVLHAKERGVHAERTKYLPFCQRYCRFFTACRGADLLDGEQIDGALAEMIALYHEADRKEKAGKELKAALRSDLLGLNGTTAEHVIKTSSDNKLTVTPLANV